MGVCRMYRVRGEDGTVYSVCTVRDEDGSVKCMYSEG